MLGEWSYVGFNHFLECCTVVTVTQSEFLELSRLILGLVPSFSD